MKKDWVKILLAFFSFVILAIFLVSIWYMKKHRDAYTINPVRPKEFPEILIVSEDAQRIDYSSPADTRRAAHTYMVSYEVNDPYPSERTYDFITKRLTSNGWQRLRYDLLNPQSPLWQAPFVPEYLDPNTVDILFPKRKQKGSYPVLWRKENWIKYDDYIIVTLSYFADLSTKKVDRDRLHVGLEFFGRDSWIKPWILKYKQIHPEEFDEGTSVPQPEK